MAGSVYHQRLVQHIKYLDKHRSPYPVRLVQQHPAQVIHRPQVGAQLPQHREGLVTVQDLDRQQAWK